MMMLSVFGVLALVCSAVVAAPTSNSTGEIWAVLVAGSNTYMNYRHQADVCHAYQIFHKNGVPDSNIIVMMYDDIAENSENPKKGKIYNKPNGPNVYGPKAVPKDYIKNAVNPDNFIHVLTGNAKAVNGVGSGKVLQSGPNDHVFVNFVDHGATGLIGFPNSYMYAKQLINALKTMHKKQMYKKLVFYMEACESGSMFNKILPSNIEIFATTAANPDQSSYACYYDKTIGAYLGDEYSVSWMEDTDTEEKKGAFSLETLLTQYKHVVKKVKDSNPQMYGQKSIKKDDVKDFQGYNSSSSRTYKDTSVERFTDAVSSRNVALMTLNRKIDAAKTTQEKRVLVEKRDKLVQGRKAVDDLFSHILAQVTNLNIEDIEMLETSRQPLSMEMMDCYETLVDSFTQKCVDITKNTYTMGHLYKLANLCSLEYASTDAVLEAYTAECTEEHRALTDVN